MNAQNNILVSIVVACRDEEKYIEKCISSLLNQKEVPGGIEIIIIDGTSEDNTFNIAKRLANHDLRIKLFSNPKKVKPPAINIGFKNSKGTFIAICDAHAIYDSHYIYNCLETLKKDSSVWCSGGPITSIGETNFGKATSLAMSSKIGVGSARHRFPKFQGLTDMASFPVFHRNVLIKIGYYDEDFEINHDDEYCYRIKKAGGKIYLNNKAKSFYYVRNEPWSLFKQYYQYGLWQIPFFNKHKLLRSYRQLVPVSFFSTIIILISVGLLFRNIFMIFFLPSIYLFTLCLTAFKVGLRYGFNIGINFPIAVTILHLSYAIGFINGILSLKFNWKK